MLKATCSHFESGNSSFKLILLLVYLLNKSTVNDFQNINILMKSCDVRLIVCFDRTVLYGSGFSFSLLSKICKRSLTCY